MNNEDISKQLCAITSTVRIDKVLEVTLIYSRRASKFFFLAK